MSDHLEKLRKYKRAQAARVDRTIEKTQQPRPDNSEMQKAIDADLQRKLRQDANPLRRKK